MPSSLRRFAPETVLAAFTGVNLVLMWLAPLSETVPFHFIWISLTIVYGYRTWPTRWTLGVLGLVCLVMTVSMVEGVRNAGLDAAELTEVPLMAAVFIAMMWHAQRRQAAMAQVARYAQEQERLRGKERDFLRDASHLLRTPITIARGFTELIRNGATDEEVVADSDVVLRELDSMTRISSRLLLLTATELNELLEPVNHDLSDLLEQAHLRWQPAAQRTWRVTTEECRIVGDPMLLESALDALIENAIHHTVDGGTITVRCTRHGQDVCLDVTDDGTGIGPELLPTLFERKWHPRLAGDRTATGLGLAIVKAIVDAHGGEVHASNAPTGGAEFTVRFAAAAMPALATGVDSDGPVLLSPRG